MNFKEDFEYYLQHKFEDLEIEAPYTIEEIVRHIDVNYIIPLKSECFTIAVKCKNNLQDKERERDIQELCQSVLSCSVIFFDNPNGAYESTCPFCYEKEYRGGSPLEGNHIADISEIAHKQNCPYLIAKDLTTNK